RGLFRSLTNSYMNLVRSRNELIAGQTRDVRNAAVLLRRRQRCIRGAKVLTVLVEAHGKCGTSRRCRVAINHEIKREHGSGAALEVIGERRHDLAALVIEGIQD